jgi:hypothetical protein
MNDMMSVLKKYLHLKDILSDLKIKYLNNDVAAFPSIPFCI